LVIPYDVWHGNGVGYSGKDRQGKKKKEEKEKGSK